MRGFGDQGQCGVLRDKSCEKPLRLAVTEDDTIDFLRTLRACISNISAKLCLTSRAKPKETLYQLELGVLLKTLERLDTGLVVVPEATLRVHESVLSIDFLVHRGGEACVLEVCAHERAGPASRRNTFAEHYQRTHCYYSSAAGPASGNREGGGGGDGDGDGGSGEDSDAEEPPERRCWLVDFNSWARRGTHPANVARAAGLAAGAVPAINVLLVFHTMDWRRVECTVWEQGVPLTETFAQTQPMLVPSRAGVALVHVLVQCVACES